MSKKNKIQKLEVNWRKLLPILIGLIVGFIIVVGLYKIYG